MKNHFTANNLRQRVLTFFGKCLWMLSEILAIPSVTPDPTLLKTDFFLRNSTRTPSGTASGPECISLVHNYRSLSSKVIFVCSVCKVRRKTTKKIPKNFQEIPKKFIKLTFFYLLSRTKLSIELVYKISVRARTIA